MVYSICEGKKQLAIEEKKKECFHLAVEQMINGQEEEALELLEQCQGYPGTGRMIRFLNAVTDQKEGHLKRSYEAVRYVEEDDFENLTEEQRKWIGQTVSKIKKEYVAYEMEEKRKAEEEKRKKLKESGIPYVGMSEKLISETSLGKPRTTVRHNYEHQSGRVYMANLYDFPAQGRCTFTARCVNGRVTEIFDGRDKGGVDPKYLYSSGSKSTASSEYATAEDLYEDRPDDFDSLEEAEEYFDDHYR